MKRRLAAIILPPYGLWLLWTGPGSLRRKVFGSLGLLLACLAEAALVIILLIQFTGLQIEWRGGYLPALTYGKTVPNYSALDARTTHVGAEVSGASPVTSSYWTGFRGPLRDGHYTEKPILTQWPGEGLRLLWRQPCGGGYSSFAIAEGLAFTLEQRRDEEVAVAYDLQTGKEVWTNSWSGKFTEYYSEEGPRTTPEYNEGKVFVLGALGELRCLEAGKGKVLWSRNILAENGMKSPTYGCSSSPLIYGEKLLVLTTGGRGRSVICYDKRDGKQLWASLDDEMGYASPTLVTLVGQTQIVACAETRTFGLNPENGQVLWEYPWRVLQKQPVVAQPVVLGPNRFLLSGGYFTGCAAVDISKTNSAFAAATVYKNKFLKNKFTSSVFWEGYVYGLDEDILTCIDASTGERKWRDGRYGYGQLLLASGRLVVLTGDGALALVRASPESHQELCRFQAIRGKTWNHPAIGDGKLLVRNAVEMACFEIATE